jgi:hypothetical protein
MNIQSSSHLPINPMFTSAPNLHELHSLMEDAEEAKLFNQKNCEVMAATNAALVCY